MTATSRDNMPRSGDDIGSSASGSWRMRVHQALAVCLFELKRNLLGKRSFPLYLLAALPVVMFGGLSLLPPQPMIEQGPGFATEMFEVTFETFILRLVVFFGCVATFMNLFRGEVLDRSLHYYFLSPIRREVLVAGKYLSGLISTSVLFGVSTALCHVLAYSPYGMSVVRAQFLGGPALFHLAAYLVVVVLACIGYGAVFLLMGILFRNPVFPAVAILLWESIIFLLPPLLKKFSVSYYLLSLCPVSLAGKPVEILAEPSPPAIAIPGIIGVTILLLALAGLKIRRSEVSYAGE